MHDDLARHAAGLGKAKTIDHVVKAQFEELQQVFTGDALHVGRLEVVTVELLLQHTVNKLDLLLFLELRAVLGNLLALVAARVASRLLVAVAHDRRRDIQAPALLGDRLFIVSHVLSSSLPIPYTRRRFGGRQPLWGIGVTSLIMLTSRPAACRERMAASRPEPGPLT